MGASTDRRAEPSFVRDLGLSTLALGAFLFPLLGLRALWSPDEGRYAEIPREMVASRDWAASSSMPPAGPPRRRRPRHHAGTRDEAPVFLWPELARP